MRYACESETPISVISCCVQCISRNDVFGWLPHHYMAILKDRPIIRKRRGRFHDKSLEDRLMRAPEMREFFVFSFKNAKLL